MVVRSVQKYYLSYHYFMFIKLFESTVGNNKVKNYLILLELLKILWSLSIDRVQLPQGWKATMHYRDRVYF